MTRKWTGVAFLVACGLALKPVMVESVPASQKIISRQVPGSITIGDPDSSRDEASDSGVLAGRPVVQPPRTDRAPNIDGKLDDVIWQTAVRINEFVQQRPLDGAPATETTEVYITYDSTNIYLGFYAHYMDPSQLRANRTDRDHANSDDNFFVYFDPFLDQQRAYVFTVNGYGVQGDSILNARSGQGGGGRFGAPRGDSSWNALFDSAGQLVEDGFTAEMSIPFKSLRYPKRQDGTFHRWGFQIARNISGKDETDVWSPVSRDVAGFLPQMGVLEGMRNLSTSRNVEVLPTFTAVQFGAVDNMTGGFVNDKADPQAGLNFKYGVTSNLTADLTFNPDFSQIESDRPQVTVNQRFDLFFPELRPFFLEGAEIFNIRGPVTMVHTRTIVDPTYGAKLTGKAGKTTLGVMYANDEAAHTTADSPTETVDTSAQTFVGRVRYDLYSESHVGAIFTDREFLDSHSRAVGIDSSFRLGDTHSLSFRAFGTQHRDRQGVDTTGYLLDAFLRKRGRNLSYGFGSYALSPDFQTDIGFVRRTDLRRTSGNVSYRWWPETWLISWGPELRYGRNYDFNGVLVDDERQIGVDFSFANNLGFRTEVSRDVERFGGLNFIKTRYRSFGRVNTSRLWGFGLGYNFGDQILYDSPNPYLGRHHGLFSHINLRLLPRLKSDISINTSRFTDTRNHADEVVFDVKIVRALTTYQFTERVVFRNITEYNTFDKTVGLNFLLTYRVNSGTAFYIGYDDRYQQGDRINEEIFPTPEFRRTNRAFFTKFQYLFRY